MKRLAFIINPISGVGKKSNLPFLINQHLDNTKYVHEILYTERRGHAYDIAKAIVKENSFDIIAIVGGDGSINEVGRAIVNTEISLAIIPAGSGNGFARHFEIPCNVERSLDYLNRANSVKVDTGMINEHHFFATCGLGFDARVTHRFDEIEKRGFFGYVQAVYQEIRKCSDIPFRFGEKESENFERDCFVVTIANTSQYGNDFTISPKSCAQDGKLELITVSKPSVLELPEFLFKAFTRNLSTFKKLEEHKNEEFLIETENRKGHIDGDPIILEEKNVVKVLPNSLNLMLAK